MKRKLLFAALFAVMGWLNVNAQQEPADAGVYYLYNTETGKFLTRGNTWGTQAVTNDFGSPWQVSIADGKYTLRMYDLVVAGSTSGLGSNGYADNGSPIAFTPSGNSNGYKLQNGSNYLCSPDTYGNSVLYNDANYNTTWQFLNVTEYKAVLAAKTSAQESAIATTAGVDLGGSTLGAIVEDANNWRFSDVSSAVPFPSNSSWTRTGVANRGGDQNSGTYGVECYQGGVTYSYTATGLAKGIYKVGIKAMFRSVNNAVCSTVGDAGFVNSSAYLSANGNLVQVKDWYSSRASASNPNSTDAFVTIANNGGYLSEVYTYVGDDGKLELKAVSESYWGGSWFLFNGITLTYYNNSVSEEDATALLATVPTAKMSNATQATLGAAVSAFEANKTIANYNTLNAAITAANISVAEYATIASGVIPTDGLTGWSKTTTAPTFHINTWSTEGNTDGSGMTTPFVENWILSGGQLGAGRVQYTFTDLNPGETYVVTARVRVFNEAATGVTGATYFVGNSTKTLEQFGSACIGDFANKGKFAVLSCAGTVDANGDLQFGVELAEGSPINWIAIKDVTIAEGTGDIPTAIELNKTSVSLTTGSADALVATITPATADDKTIIWSTSDASVVSVSGGNIVALKAGTATITANAFAGDNVNATCTVTVADAAAPAFYSETIAAGDYYIMNAATGTFLGGGNSWGTQASVVEHGIPFGVAVGEGVYTLDSYTYNKATDHFLNGTYVDGASTNLYITSLGNGKFSISTADGSAFETVLAGSTVVSNTAANADSPLAQWYFLSKNDRDKMLQSATAENPVDATYYIKQANISRNRSAGAFNVNAWNPYSDAGGNNENFNFYKANAAVNVWQTIEGIPNGTYTLKMQGCTTGSAVLWANEASVDILANNGDITDQATASTAFSAGKYVNTVDVTVTNRMLSITVKSDDTDKVTTFDNFELYLTSYTANTGVTASIDKAEIELGSTAQITAATDPATASFNALTYASSDETVATVDENGQVTGQKLGTATITVTANEMENFSTTVEVTVVAVTPTALAFETSEIALNKETATATLVLVPTPADANTSVTWTSSDESIATVADGVVTALANGTATITATSTLDTEVKAEATVTVAFPEAATPDDYYVNSGATRTNYTVGENLIKNGAFEYGNNFYGWTVGDGTPMSASNFNLITEDDNHYIKASGHTGAGGVNSIGTGWAIEAGKTYVFGYRVKATSAGNSEFHKVTLTNTLGTETLQVSDNATAVGTDWTDVKYTFTNTDGYAYVQFRARWLNSANSFDDFYLCEVVGTTEGNVDYVTAAIPTANIGTGAFQYSQDAIVAANALVQGEATVADVEAAYTALTTINEPADGQLFNVVLTYAGWTYNNKAMTYLAGDRSDMGGYNIKYQADANQNLAQAFTFTKVSDNNYKMSQIDADGNVRYISTGVPYSGSTGQIRTTTNADDALAVTVIPTATEGVWNLKNTEANNYIGSQDAGVYTVNSHIDFNIVETSKPSIEINTKAAGYGTVMLPFAVAEENMPEGVTVYTCSEIKGDGITLNLEAVNALEANKPYIIEGNWDETLTGDAQGTALTYGNGLLTGVYAATLAPVDSYVLQKNDDVVGFYKVAENEQPTVGANRAYLTAPATSGGVKAFFFDEGTATAIQSVFSGVAAGEIYDLSGRKLNKLQKGVNIVNGKKVMVK